MECVAEVAKKLGIYEEFSEGLTIEQRIRIGFDTSGVQDLVSWEEFNEKDYYVVPTVPDWKNDPVSMVAFYENPDNNPLTTPTGKIEFYSQRLADNFPDDKERGPVPGLFPYRQGSRRIPVRTGLAPSLRRGGKGHSPWGCG